MRCDHAQVYAGLGCIPILAAAAFTYLMWQRFRGSGVELGDRLMELDFSNAIAQAGFAGDQAGIAANDASNLLYVLENGPPPLAAYASEAARLYRELEQAQSDSGSVSGNGLSDFDGIVDDGSDVLR